MAPPSALQKATSHRDNIRTTIEYLEGELDDNHISPLDEAAVSHLLAMAKTSQTDIMKTHEDILVCNPSDLDPHNYEYHNLMKRAMKLLSGFTGLKLKFTTTASIPHSTTIASGNGDIRLPRLELPSFDGDLNQWVSFRDMFISTVHNNTSLSKSQKFTYLKAKLMGEAARQISSMLISDANYDIAWSQLTDRYQNDREILFAIMRRFDQQPSVQSSSPTSIRQLVDVTRECLRSLDVLKLPTEHWDAVFLYYVIKKMDPSSKELWEQGLQNSSIPSLKSLFEFLEQRARALAASAPPKPNAKNQQYNHSSGNRSQQHRVHYSQSSSQCRFCGESVHILFKCKTFIGWTDKQRSEAIKKANLCYNCLGENHSVSECPSTKVCKTCSGKHHTLLHRGKPQEKSTSSSSSQGTDSTTKSFHISSSISQDKVPQQSIVQTPFPNFDSILATAVVLVRDQHGDLQTCRVFLDNGSNTHFVTESFCQKLGLRKKKYFAEATGLGNQPVTSSSGFVSVVLCSRLDNCISYVVKALTIKKISGALPLFSYDHTQWPHLNSLQLADPLFYKSQNVDMLLGAEIFFSIILNGKISGPPHTPIAINSEFGWLVGGGAGFKTPGKLLTYTQVATPTTTPSSNENLDFLLQRFWQIEELSQSRLYTKEEQACEDHFVSTYKRNSEGRFELRLPFKNPRPPIGSSLKIAIKRLQYLERRLQSNPSYKEEYVKFMKDYEELGHMVEVPAINPDSSHTGMCYIPHHFVLKESSSTTKFRVVFDASSKTSNGVSLNETMMVGPVIQDNLVDIICRFRLHKIAFTADAAKMYRQFLLSPEETDFQRIVWREDSSQPIRHFALRTVTYGTGPASFMSTRALKEAGVIQKDEYPQASSIIQRDFYIDDMISGEPTVEEALDSQGQIITLLKNVGINLRKWSSNSQAVLDSLPPEMRETQSLLSFDIDSSIKTLGIYWNPQTDQFSFKVNSSPTQSKYTKRSVLSDASKLFDPSGWLAPVIIKSKMFMQILWKLKVEWDECIPEDLQQQWIDFQSDIRRLETLNINRFFFAGSVHTCPSLNRVSSCTSQFHLVGFCDSSERAYAAAIYLCAYNNNDIPSVTLITSKTRVAPAKQVSLPRLELCGALLLAELMTPVKKSLSIAIQSITAFTDSTVVLSWIKSSPSRWKTFVANRVTKIQNEIPSEAWGHVKGEDNPADCASRGITSEELIHHPLWWQGPSWLKTSIPNPNSHSLAFEPALGVDEEKKPAMTFVSTIVESTTNLLHKFSNLHTLLCVTAYMLRFVHKTRELIISRKSISGDREQQASIVEVSGVGRLRSSRRRLDNDKAGPVSRSHEVTSITPSELDDALSRWIKITQQQNFSRELSILSKSKSITKDSPLLSLHPFIDSSGFLRVGGRLRHSNLPAETKNPILLPRHSQLTRLIIESTHQDYLHAGPQLVQAIISRKFWIIRGRDAIRHQLKKCVRCTRLAARTQTQFMGDLPSARVTPARPFQKCGVDFAGPFLLKPDIARSKQTIKGYLAIFVCFVTRAIHIEVVSDLSTNAFQASLRRFVSRRGKPSDIHSDNGTNFVGAARELKEWITLANSNEFNNKISKQCAKQGITWHFIPPAAPHFGGLWEASVRSVKYHLKRILGPHRLTYEQLTTIVTQIEACLNSRPLTPASSDPNDLSVLTPGHFLIGAPLVSVPEPDLTSLKEGHLDRWQLLQQLQQHFWHRWSSEFLTRLQQRPKWAATKTNINIGDLVLIKDERMPPQQWKLGRIITLHPGQDNLIRVATLRTAEGEIQRPVVKLCLLPIDNCTSG